MAMVPARPKSHNMIGQNRHRKENHVQQKAGGFNIGTGRMAKKLVIAVSIDFLKAFDEVLHFQWFTSR